MKRKLLWAFAFVTLLAADSQAREIIGRGDFLFYLDTAAFRGKGGKVIEEVSVRIPNNELKFTVHGGAFRSHVNIMVEIVDHEGKSVIQDAQEMTFTEPDEKTAATSLHFQTVMKRYHLAPGKYMLSYAIEDMQAQKMTISGLVRGKNKVSAVRRMALDLPDMPDDVPSFSEAKFVWEVVQHEGRQEYHANPPRLYGLYKDEVIVYMELYLPDDMASSTTFDFNSIFIDGKGEPVKDTELTLSNPSDGESEAGGPTRAYPVVVREDLSKFPAGVYTLYFTFGLDGRQLSRIKAGNFSVAWDIRTWEVPRREFLAEARFLFGDIEFQEFTEMAAGDQEKMLDKMWKEADPSPETGVNEAYDMFLSRLAFVNANYNEQGPAIFSPRGQIYMRYGPPDELIVDVIPMNRETLAEAMEKVEDQFHAMNYTSSSLKPYGLTASRNNLVDPRGISSERAGDHQAFPFELWVFQARGNPLLERDRSQELDIGMRYLFVDRGGYGRYKLESSSSIVNK